MRIERTTTGLIIYDPSMIIKRKCLQYFALSSPKREFFIYNRIDDNHTVLYVTSAFEHLEDKALQDELKTVNIKNIRPSEGDKIILKMTREPRSDLQRDCINKLTSSNSKKITVQLKPGTGKAEPYSRKIPSPDSDKGWKLMGDIQLNDRVFDLFGNPTTVVDIFEQGMKDVYNITFEDGRKAFCTSEHLWTIRSHKLREWSTVDTDTIIKSLKRNKRNKCYIPICQPVQYPQKEVPIDPWVLGCFISNGCLTSGELQLYAASDEVPNKIASLYGYTIKKITNISAYIFYDTEGKLVKTNYFFRNIPELIDVTNYKKYVPDLYMFNDIENRMKFIQGLLDVNGTIEQIKNDSSISYKSNSKVLLLQIRSMLHSLGYTCKVIDICTNSLTYMGSLRFIIPNTVKQLFFSLTSKKICIGSLIEEYKSAKYYNDLRIVNVEYSHRERCRCIVVDNPEHLYLTEDYIVTHNTFMSIYSIAKLGVKPLIIAPTTLIKNQWIENMIESGIAEEDIATRLEDGARKKVCIITITMIENHLRDNFEDLIKLIDDGNYGLKIIDEAHLHLKGMLKLDTLCNIKRNWYLSATLGRSDAEEDGVMNRSFRDADRFVGSIHYEEYRHQYVSIILQDIYYNPSKNLCSKFFKFGKKGLVRASYYNMLMNYEMGKPLIANIIGTIKRTKKMFTSYGKILVLVPLLEIIDRLMAVMKEDPYFKDIKISYVDGSLSLATKKEAMGADIILSTSLSMGVGVDIYDLSTVINFDQYSSPIITEQIFGRLRTRNDDKTTFYVDICDHVKYAKSIERWGRKRRTLLPYLPGAESEIKRLPDIRN